MIVLNFAHPFNGKQLDQLQSMLRGEYQLIEIQPHFDESAEFVDQVQALIEGTGITAHQWQSQPVVILPPAYAPICSLVIAELHGRMGSFPSIIRMRPVEKDFQTGFEIAEIIPLNTVRQQARQKRID